MISFNVKNKLIDLTTAKTTSIVDNIYRHTLRELLNQFGDLYYLDANNNAIQVKCAHGAQDRLAGKNKKDNTLILPYISVTEVKTSNSDERRRYSPIVISEKLWNSKLNRAERYLSLSPRPIDLTYKVNIWTKYKSDMDMLRSSIFGIFNPELNIKTEYSDYCKAYIENEQDLGNTKATDQEDRTIQKTITIVVETYIPSPKFLFTSTGIIDDQFYEFTIEDSNDVIRVKV